MTVQERTPRKALPRGLKLEGGLHRSFDDGMCLLEAAAYLAGYSNITDHPGCVSSVIGAFGRSWNDSLPDDDRQKLKPYAKKMLRTATGSADEEVRAWMATDWLVRECAPAWLRLAGLTEHAETLERVAPVLSSSAAKLAQKSLDAAKKDAAAAWDAARAAARDAAWAAAGAAARDAAWDAAGAAARDALAPTVKILQKSALGLLDRMIEVGKTEQVAA